MPSMGQQNSLPVVQPMIPNHSWVTCLLLMRMIHNQYLVIINQFTVTCSKPDRTNKSRTTTSGRDDQFRLIYSCYNFHSKHTQFTFLKFIEINIILFQLYGYFIRLFYYIKIINLKLKLKYKIILPYSKTICLILPIRK